MVEIVEFKGKQDGLPRAIRPIFHAMLQLTRNQPGLFSMTDEGVEWEIELRKVERGSGSATPEDQR